MEECRTAIPVWVMPIYRVAESIHPGQELFDVVIVDEASQSGPEALFLPYLARKMVIVGDDQQISPDFVGLDRADVNQLRMQYISDLPHRDAYGVDHSLFELAEIRYGGRIRLREHFRCMPEIIQFSNNLCYLSQPLIPLKQYGAGRLSPVVITRHVKDGYVKGNQSVVNPPEADAICKEIVRCCKDPIYRDKTIGVISLQGHYQARHIEKLLLDQLGPEEMERRQLVCGDAYAFQGDERDVIFLSLVAAPTEGRRSGAMSGEGDKRRFNVAASRAREQMWLFYTATLNDLSSSSLRYQLIEYCLHPHIDTVVEGIEIEELRRLAVTADRSRTSAPGPFDSWFEVDVFLKVADQGYRVIPQYEVAGYRIDLVVEGMERRLAVECDGDAYHGPEQYLRDMARQRDLERCGWTFWRVRGSTFYVDQEQALEGLWENLQHLQILPKGQEDTERESRNSSEKSTSRSEVVDRDGPDLSVGEEYDRAEEEVTNSSSSGEDFPEIPRLVLGDLWVLTGSPAVSVRADVPYQNWTPRPLPDPRSSRPAELIPALVEIVRVEGPMLFHRACQIFVKAASMHRVRSASRENLHQAFRLALRQGLLEERNEYQSDDLGERIVRVAGSAAVVVRDRGGRGFDEIPPSEIAEVMARLRRQNTNLTGDELCRAVIEFYEIRRMTSNIHSRLIQIEKHQIELLSRESNQTR